MDALRLLGALGLIAGSALAQDVERTAPRATPTTLQLPRIPVHSAPDDMGQSYGIWAAGTDYKASFHGDMTFVPYLGADYPVSRPWSWRTVSVRVGELELLTENREPERHEFEYRYEYDHGVITEAYDVRRDGLEQTFVLTERPGPGDLVIRGRVTTTLATPAAPAAHRQLEYCDADGQSILSYGTAFAIAADGDRLPITTSVQAAEIELRVPADWLDHAAMPVVIDPLLATTLLVNSPMRHQFLDIGHDDERTGANTMVVAGRQASLLDDDLLVYITDETLVGVTALVFSDLTTAWDARRGSCSFVGGADRWVIAFQRYFRNGVPKRSLLRVHLHDSGSTGFSTSVTGHNPPSPINDASPDVGGVAAWDQGEAALIVFEREDNSATGGDYRSTGRTEVHAMLFDATLGAFGSSVSLGGGGSTDCQSACVTPFRTDGSEWVSAFEILRPSLGTPDWEVRARKVDANGLPSTALWGSPQVANGNVHEFGPAIDGRDGRYLIAFTSADANGNALVPSLGDRCWAQRVDWDSGPAANPVSRPSTELHNDPAGRVRTCDVTYDWTNRSLFTVTWNPTLTVPSGHFIARIGYDGLVTEGPLGLAAGPLDYPSASVFDGTTRTTLTVWPAATSVHGRILEYSSAAPWTAAGSTCSATTLRWVGAQQIGTETGRVSAINNQATNVPLHFLMCSLAPASQSVPHPAVLPTCKLLVDNVNGYLGLLNLGVGNSVVWSFPIPSWVDPVTFYFQDWMLDGTQFEGSDRLTVPVVK